MNRGQLLTMMSLCGLSVSAYASVDAAGQTFDQKTSAPVEAFYGLSEDAAVTHLAQRVRVPSRSLLPATLSISPPTTAHAAASCGRCH
jgi:hypothetical protein